MDEETARRLLLEGDHQQRLMAARSLLGRVTVADRPLLTTTAAREYDQYVRAALSRLLVSLPTEDNQSGPDAATEHAARHMADAGLRSQVIRELTDQLTH